MDFYKFFSIYVFEVTESIADILIKLSCLSDFKNLGQLLVQGVLGGTGDWVLYISMISSIFMFSRSGEFIADISNELPCTGDLENPIQLPVQEVLGGTGDLGLLNLHNFLTIYVWRVE